MKIPKDFLAFIGRKGGQSKSESKVKAAKINIEKAREKRWPKIKKLVVDNNNTATESGS